MCARAAAGCGHSHSAWDFVRSCSMAGPLPSMRPPALPLLHPCLFRTNPRVPKALVRSTSLVSRCGAVKGTGNRT